MFNEAISCDSFRYHMETKAVDGGVWVFRANSEGSGWPSLSFGSVPDWNLKEDSFTLRHKMSYLSFTGAYDWLSCDLALVRDTRKDVPWSKAPGKFRYMNAKRSADDLIVSFFDHTNQYYKSLPVDNFYHTLADMRFVLEPDMIL
jgi:hypothetical protein